MAKTSSKALLPDPLEAAEMLEVIEVGLEERISLLVREPMVSLFLIEWPRVRPLVRVAVLEAEWPSSVGLQVLV